MNNRRAALPVHTTPVTDQAYDGGAMLSACPADAQSLQAMHAWRDGGRSADAPTSYKFPHHVVSQDGAVGEASTRACKAGIDLLNQPDGGGIPGGDQQGVYDHLAGHLMDAGLVPNELNSARRRAAGPERRYSGDFRLAGDATARHLVGHAAVFNQFSDPISDWGGEFREKIAPGAFTKTLQEADVRALWNHNPDFPLGRNRSGTLTLTEDAIGLAFDVTLADTQIARDLVTWIERGDVTQNSFGFQTVKDSWQIATDAQSGQVNQDRTLIEVRLFDVSPVTYPAYAQTDLGVRAQLLRLGIDWDAVNQIAARSRQGRALLPRERELVDATIEVLRSLGTEPDQPIHSPPKLTRTEPARLGHSIARRRRELELLALSS